MISGSAAPRRPAAPAGNCALVGRAAAAIVGAMPKNKKTRKTDYAQQALRSAWKNTNIKNLSLKGRKPKA